MQNLTDTLFILAHDMVITDRIKAPIGSELLVTLTFTRAILLLTLSQATVRTIAQYFSCLTFPQ